jgi:hypothetical protein
MFIRSSPLASIRFSRLVSLEKGSKCGSKDFSCKLVETGKDQEFHRGNFSRGDGNICMAESSLLASLLSIVADITEIIPWPENLESLFSYQVQLLRAFLDRRAAWPTACNMLWEKAIQHGSFWYTHRRFHRAQPHSRRLYTLTFQDSRSAAYGFFPSESQLESVLRALNAAGFENEDLCVFIASEHPIAERIGDLDHNQIQDLSTDASPERVIAWLSSYGAVVIPEVGLFVGSREYQEALALPGKLLANSERGVFAGLGISPTDAARYESRMRDKSSFVYVSCDDLAQSEWARELLSTMGAEEVSLLRRDGDSPKEQEGAATLLN